MRTIPCDSCGRKFGTKRALAQHRWDAHGLDDHPFGCGECRRTFNSALNLAKHRQAEHAGNLVPIGRRPTAAEVEPVCVECGELGVLVDGGRIYPHRPDLHAKRFYLCECGAYCGCHGSSIVPLGYPAGPETRRARNHAHEAFDPLWREGELSRAEAYDWLALAVGIERDKCHIAMMTAEQARAVCRAVLARKRADAA